MLSKKHVANNIEPDFRSHLQMTSPGFCKFDKATACKKGTKQPEISFCRSLKRLIFEFSFLPHQLRVNFFSQSLLLTNIKKPKNLIPQKPKYLNHRNKQKNQINQVLQQQYYIFPLYDWFHFWKKFIYLREREHERGQREWEK